MHFLLFLLTVCVASSHVVTAADESAPAITAEAALAKLQSGNERFARSASSASKPTRARRLATANGQHPFAIIVGCSDSRTPPEIVFDQNIGDLFVVRTAGNLADDLALGSIEYAVEHLGARLIVVLGHARCGAVAAAVESASAPGHVGAIVTDIRPSVDAVRSESGELRKRDQEQRRPRGEKDRRKIRAGGPDFEGASSRRLLRFRQWQGRLAEQDD